MDVQTARWARLSEYALAKFPRPGLGFADMHAAIAHAKGGRPDLVEDIIERASGPVAGLTRTLAKGFLQMSRQNWSEAADAFVEVQPHHARLGGSNAQRDLIEFSLAVCQAQDARRHEARTVLSITRPRAIQGAAGRGLTRSAAGGSRRLITRVVTKLVERLGEPATVCLRERPRPAMLAGILLQRIGGAHIGHQIACGQNAADIGSVDLASVRAQHIGAVGNAFRRQRDIIGDDDVACPGLVGNPDVGGVRPIINDDKPDERVRVWPDAAIADHDRPTAVTYGDGDDLILHRAGIGIDVNLCHPQTIGQAGGICICSHRGPILRWRGDRAIRYIGATV